MSSILLPGGVLAGRKTLRHHRTPTPAQAYEMASGFAEFLGTIYPGHLWRVQINDDMVSVINLGLHRSRGFRVALQDIDLDGKVLMRAGGELLERGRVSRGKKNGNEFGALSRDFLGNVKGM